jgi:uncharacterized iron-regulated membrane protein
MGALKRLAFYLGLVIGWAMIALVGAAALIYLFTGKLIAIGTGEERTKPVLMTPDEVVELVRRQVQSASAGAVSTADAVSQSAGGEGGEDDDEE